MKNCLWLLLLVWSCNSKPACEKTVFSQHLLDSARAKSDTSYTKPYRSQDFATAEYYVNRKDTSVCQVMRDDSGRVRQVLMAHRNIRLYTAEYFANGQLKAQLEFDSLGRLSGEGIYYYESGCAKSKGNYSGGLYKGDWKNFDEYGKLKSTDYYDSLGQLRTSDPAH